MLSLPLSALLLAAPQGDPLVEVLHTEMPGFAQSEVPGHPGIGFSAIGSLRVAPNGRYVCTGYFQDLGTVDFVLQDGQIVLKEGDPAPWHPGQTVTLIRGAATDSAGRTTVALVSGGNRPFLVQREFGTWNIEGEFGDPIPGLPGGTYGTFYDPEVRDDGTVGFMNDNAGGLGFGLNDFVFGDDMVLARIGTDAPSGQLGGGGALWSAFDFAVGSRGLRLAHNTSDWMASGSLSSGHGVVTVNNAVVAQTGFVLPGSPFTQTVLAFDWLSMDADGSWWMLGQNANVREFFAVRDGALYAKTGDPIVTGDSRVWSNAASSGKFAFAASNGAHNYLAGHTTIGANNRAPVLTYNGTEVLLEELDLIDVDGDGSFSENVQFRGFESLGAGVDNQGRLICTVSLRPSGSFTNYTSVVRISPASTPRLELTNVTGGQTATVRVHNAATGKIAQAVFSIAGAGPTAIPTPFGEALLAVGSPRIETSRKTVTGSGEAIWNQPVPASLSGMPVWAHAAVFDLSTLQLTNAVATTIQ